MIRWNYSDFIKLSRSLIKASICQIKGRFRLNDALTSMCHANVLRVFEFIGERHIPFILYGFVYQNFRIFDLDSQSVVVWVLTMLMNDHFYYWEHRFLHETNIGWAAHQVQIYNVLRVIS
jgi:alkylglycerol monooxygenase